MRRVAARLFTPNCVNGPEGGQGIPASEPHQFAQIGGEAGPRGFPHARIKSSGIRGNIIMPRGVPFLDFNTEQLLPSYEDYCDQREPFDEPSNNTGSRRGNDAVRIGFPCGVRGSCAQWRKPAGACRRAVRIGRVQHPGRYGWPLSPGGREGLPLHESRSRVERCRGEHTMRGSAGRRWCLARGCHQEWPGMGPMRRRRWMGLACRSGRYWRHHCRRCERRQQQPSQKPLRRGQSVIQKEAAFGPPFFGRLFGLNAPRAS